MRAAPARGALAMLYRARSPATEEEQCRTHQVSLIRRVRPRHTLLALPPTSRFPAVALLIIGASDTVSVVDCAARKKKRPNAWSRQRRQLAIHRHLQPACEFEFGMMAAALGPSRLGRCLARRARHDRRRAPVDAALPRSHQEGQDAAGLEPFRFRFEAFCWLKLSRRRWSPIARVVAQTRPSRAVDQPARFSNPKWAGIFPPGSKAIELGRDPKGTAPLPYRHGR